VDAPRAGTEDESRARQRSRSRGPLRLPKVHSVRAQPLLDESRKGFDRRELRARVAEVVLEAALLRPGASEREEGGGRRGEGEENAAQAPVDRRGHNPHWERTYERVKRDFLEGVVEPTKEGG